MNNLLTSAKLVLVCLVLHANTLVAANPTAPAKPASFEAGVYVNKSNKICLAIEKTTAQSVVISLHQVGKTLDLFTQQVGSKQTKAAFRLDVDQLPNGAYELEIKAANGERLVKQIILGTPTQVVTGERLLAIQ